MSSSSIVTEKRTQVSFLKLSSIALVFLLVLAPAAFGGVVFVHAATGAAALQHGPILLSGTATNAKEPQVQTSADGTYVYVTYTRGSGGIYFAVSSNGGSSFGAAKKISTASGTAQFPVMITGDGYQSVNLGDVYVSWAQTISGTLQIFVASSSNNGGTFSVKQLSTGGGITPALAAWGSDVYVTWYQTTPCPVTALNPLNSTTGEGQSGCIYVASSANNGGTWSAPVELNPSVKGESQIVASGEYAYLVADGVWFSSFGVGASNWNGNSSSPTGWTTPITVYSFYFYGSGCATFSTPCVFTFGREPWIAGNGLDVYITFNAIDLSSSPTGTPIYRIYGLTSNDGGVSWYSGTSTSLSNLVPGLGSEQSPSTPPSITTPAQQQAFLLSGSVSNDWEPENVASGSNGFMTFHSLANQGIYMTSTTNSGSSWSTPVKVPSQKSGTSAYAHIFTSDGSNVWVMWGQVKSGSVWNAYVSDSRNSGGTWSAPLDISNNNVGVAAGNQDVTLFGVASIGTTCYAVWTYTNGGTSQVMFASITA